MIHVGRINYELGLCDANFGSRNTDIIPGPVTQLSYIQAESKHYVLEEDPVFHERIQLDYCKVRRIRFGRFRCHRINLENLR
jgi:hypothetical protein